MISLADIRSAANEVLPITHRTPVLTCAGIERRVPGGGVPLVFKAENLQRTGSFKIRGAYYRLSQLSAAERKRGVAAASAGNHAQGVALAAKLLGITATIYMPEFASIAKIKATEGYGAKVVLAGANFDEAVAACAAFVEQSGAVYVPPYDDDAIIAGQGTLGLELLEDIQDLESVVAPIGGGGLFAGLAVALKESRPEVRLIGVQAETADNAVRSFQAGKLLENTRAPETICDGIAVKSPSPRTFEYIRKYADDVVPVTDMAVADALLLLLERAKLVVEPSGAAGLAAVLSGAAKPRGKTAIVLTGGNIDSLRLADLTQREMLRADRYLKLYTACGDFPGSLARLLAIIAAERGNVANVGHDRLSSHVALGHTRVEFLIEVRDKAHGEKIIAAIAAAGYPINVSD